MLRVSDLDESIQYYTEALGMQLLRKKDNETGRYTLAFLSYGTEEENTVFELTYNWCPPPPPLSLRIYPLAPYQIRPSSQK
jgi:lactoylglutathione lyase